MYNYNELFSFINLDVIGVLKYILKDILTIFIGFKGVAIEPDIINSNLVRLPLGPTDAYLSYDNNVVVLSVCPSDQSYSSSNHVLYTAKNNYFSISTLIMTIGDLLEEKPIDNVLNRVPSINDTVSYIVERYKVLSDDIYYLDSNSVIFHVPPQNTTVNRSFFVVVEYFENKGKVNVKVYMQEENIALFNRDYEVDANGKGNAILASTEVINKFKQFEKEKRKYLID